MSPIQQVSLTVDYALARLGIVIDEERGLTTTEVAVITFLLVGAAIVVGGIIFTAAKHNANNIPEPSTPAP